MQNTYSEVDSFVKLINLYLKNKENTNSVERVLDSLEIFLYKFPKPFCSHILSNIENYKNLKKSIQNYKSPLSTNNRTISSSPQLIRSIKKLVSSLQKRGGVIIFILHDGAILRECFRMINPKNIVSLSLRVSRKDLGYKKQESFEKYLYLFSKINDISLRNTGYGWNEFFHEYRMKLKLNKISDPKLNSLCLSILGNIERVIPDLIFRLQVPITVVDTGLQGTFAIFLCWILKEYKKVKDIDFKLISCYPWLPKFFQERSFSKNIKGFPLLENSVINNYSKSLPFFGRFIYSSGLKIEKEKLRKILNV